LPQITLLVTFNFGVQLLIDLLSVGFVDRIGYRASMVMAHILSAFGLLLLTVLPEVLPSAFAGILGDNLKIGILTGIIFPVLLLIGILLCRRIGGKP